MPPRPTLATLDASPARTSGRTVAVLLAVAAVGAVVTHVHPAAPVLVVALGLGVAARTAGLVPAAARTGLTWTSTHVLRTGVALLGLQLSLGDLGRLGVRGVLAAVASVVVTFTVTLTLGRVLGVPDRLRLLVATGFSICGAAAVAAMTSVLPDGRACDERAEHATGENDATAVAVALVALFGTLALVALPLAARALDLPDETAALWIGLSVHEVGQVVAAAGSVSAAAVAVAVVAKLARVLLLAPVVATVGAGRRGRPGARPPLVPPFVAAFLVLVLVRSTGVVPGPVVDAAHVVSTVALTAALTALGAQVDVRGLVQGGGRALALGAASTVVVTGVGLAGALVAAHA
ncbi:putative sulfate exporter family transporter [Cellulomonas sp.]|uniref:YeiH family protein n=1 Tax=Cellulomonas sp. TaxID=40001 RepID=UPI001B1247DE|nr:putative sulfate exporter family transporter [Cellulomonas sp.]MBO9554347.1 putative sulfate exporter family transporter [Cellulomonas sp.]